jgi:nitroimidazol reductase NimA-like FMN-containing flavoprotein (pyridoxamine 5'-phosphate oxidase superfamily)
MLAAFMQETYGTEIDFSRWMLVGLPLSAMMLPLAWLILTRFAFKVDFKTSDEGKAVLRQLKDELGEMTVPEKRVAIVFVLMAATWVLRPLLVTLPGLSALDDSGIAMAGGIALFLIPSGEKSDPMLLRWTYAERLPWSVLILFGGGLTLASAVTRTGLAEWLGADNSDFPARCRCDRDRVRVRPNRPDGTGHPRRKLCLHVAGCNAAQRDRVWLRHADHSKDGTCRHDAQHCRHIPRIDRRFIPGTKVFVGSTTLSGEYTVSKENKIRQLREKAAYDRDTVHEILDAGLVAHVGFVQDGAPVVVPMLYGRDGETLYLHGARKARVIRLLEGTGTACINVTLLDGLVFARSAFASSMNYRSVTVYGNARLVDDWEDKKHALHVIAECTMPGRRAELRQSTDNELKMTGVIAVDIESASAKISAGMPDDEDMDLDTPVWAGVLPLESRFTTLQPDDLVQEGVEPSDALKAMENTKL